MAVPVLSDTLRALAQRQWRDYQSTAPGNAFADPELSISLEEAYAVQLEVARLRCAAGDAIAGYKIGCIGPGVVKQFGMSGPIHARLFRSEVHPSACTLSYVAYANLAIEGEMALQIGRNGEVVAAFPAIELHHFVFRAPRKTLAELIANNGINAGIVIPQDRKMASLDRWKTARTLSISINGAAVDTGDLWAMPSGPTDLLDWLRGELSRFGEAFRPGDLVLAGTPLGLHPIGPGDHVVVSVDGEAFVDCRIA